MKKLYTALVLTLFVLPLVAQNIPSYVPKDGLVGYWPFNGNANDESGNGNHGTVNGATITADRNGVANSAYSFDGVNNYINCGNNNNLQLNNFTISVWSNLNESSNWSSGVNGGGFFIHKGCDNPNYPFNGWSYRIYYQSPYGLITDQFSNNRNAIENNLNDLIGKWNNIVFSNDNSKLKIYYNGIKIDSINLNGNTSINNDNLLIGCRNETIDKNCVLNDFFSGKLDDIAIYNRALSEQEISQLYAGCTKETATSSNFNTLMYTTNAPLNLTATPTGGSFSGNGVANNAFNPSKAKLGKNQVKYNFKNTTGCKDSTDFTMLVVDTVGATCIKYDTIKVNKYDTVKVTKFDTITVTNNVTKYDTVIVNKTNYDTVSILKIKFKLTTGISANQLSSLNIYPNPTSDVLHIEVPDAKALEGYRYRILDALGKEVYNQLVTQTTTEIPLKTLGAAGIYQFEILDAKNASIQSNKIVLQ